MLWQDLDAAASGFVGGLISSLPVIFYIKQLLKKQDQSPIIENVTAPRQSFKRQNTSKRIPKALTDEMAYMKELLEKGGTRG